MISDAKQVLLRALETIEEVEQDMGAEVGHLCVVWCVYKEDEEGNVHHNTGWNMSTAPAWLIAAMLRHAAEGCECSVSPDESEEEE